MSFTETFKETFSINGAQLAPISKAGGTTADTGGIDMSKFNRAVFIGQIGVIQAGATVTFKLQQSIDNVTFADVTSGGLTTVDAAGKIVTAEMNSSQLSATYRYLRMRATIAVDAALVSMIGFGFCGKYPPVNASDVAAVTQRLVL